VITLFQDQCCIRKPSGRPHEQPTPCQAKLSHSACAFVFQTDLCNPCTIHCPEKCNRKLFFSCCVWQCQAGEEGGCVWASLQGAGRGEMVDTAPSHAHTSKLGTFVLKNQALTPVRCSFGARQARGPREPAGGNGEITAKIHAGHRLS